MKFLLLVWVLKKAMEENAAVRIIAYAVALLIGCTLIYAGVMAPSKVFIVIGVLFLISIAANIAVVIYKNKNGW